MSSSSEVDEVAAMELLHLFASAVFDKKSFVGAMMLMSPQNRREHANDWVVDELEFRGRDLLQWSEREDATEALASMDTDHRVWKLFAAETLASWQEGWAVLPDVLDGRGSARLTLHRHLTLEELRALGLRWTAHPPKRTGPVRVRVDFEEIDWVLHIADINVDD